MAAAWWAGSTSTATACKDIGALRNNGFEVFLGRAPDDATLAKLTMGCDPLYFTDGSTTRQTTTPAVLGDLNGDGCDEVCWRYTETNRSGVIILFGYDAGGARCGGRTTASWVRLAADGEVGGNVLGLGVAMARAGKLPQRREGPHRHQRDERALRRGDAAGGAALRDGAAGGAPAGAGGRGAGGRAGRWAERR